MVNKNLIKLIETLNGDIEKAKEFSSKNTKEELYDYCVSLVPGYSKEEFFEFMAYLSKVINPENKCQQISEKDLEKISGGFVGLIQEAIQVINAGKMIGQQLGAVIRDLF